MNLEETLIKSSNWTRLLEFIESFFFREIELIEPKLNLFIILNWTESIGFELDCFDS